MQIPLTDVATVNLLSGASYIYREQQQRYLPIKFSVRDRDLGGAIQEAQARIASEVPLPPGLRMEWVGEFGNLQDAIARLKLVVPLSLVMIAMLLWINFGSVTDTLLAMSVIPMAIIGGVLALFVTGIPFSVSAAIGFIALFGIAVMDGIIVLSQYNNLIDAGLERTAAALRTGALQMRPVLMTCIIAGVGLVAGRDVVRDRLPGSEAARGRRRRRHDAGADPHPGDPAGADPDVLPPQKRRRAARLAGACGAIRRPAGALRSHRLPRQFL